VAPLAAAALLAGSCGYDILTREMVTSGTVATYRAPGAQFGSYATFAIVDRLGIVTEATPPPPSVTAPALVAHVRAKLEERGFTWVSYVDPTTPPSAPVPADLAVNLTALETAQSAPAFWLGYPGYWQPAAFGRAGDSWAYPWSWVPIPARAGTVLVELADLRGAAGGQVEVVWAALGYAVSAGPDSYDSVSVLGAVDQAFAQSPYLTTGGVP
jgi:hypothetical protein